MFLGSVEKECENMSSVVGQLSGGQFNKFQPLRVTFKQVCCLLGISRDGLYALMERDSTFPKGIKDGNSRQAPVYFDYQDLIAWWEFKKTLYKMAS